MTKQRVTSAVRSWMEKVAANCLRACRGRRSRFNHGAPCGRALPASHPFNALLPGCRISRTATRRLSTSPLPLRPRSFSPDLPLAHKRNFELRSRPVERIDSLKCWRAARRGRSGSASLAAAAGFWKDCSKSTPRFPVRPPTSAVTVLYSSISVCSVWRRRSGAVVSKRPGRQAPEKLGVGGGANF